MKIQPINKHIFVPIQFKGLWGNESVGLIPDAHTIYKQTFYGKNHLNIIYKDYYPFLDEPQEEIEKAKSDFEHNKIPVTSKIDTPYPTVYGFMLKQRIPVKKKTYNNYINGKLFSFIEKIVTKKLQKAGLSMFIK